MNAHEDAANGCLPGGGNLSFEEFEEPAPGVLWRLVSRRAHGDRQLRHVNWFASQDAAEAHRDWINQGRGQSISLTKYRIDEAAPKDC